MDYISTRNSKEKTTASEAIVKGIAPDGGLYVPESIPALDISFKDLLTFDYKRLAAYILGRYLTDFTGPELEDCIESAYDEKFDTAEIAPLVKAGDLYFLELFHGATCAFKDLALSILPYLLTKAVKKTGIQKEIVILTATSGDTGKAALESFSGVAGTKIIVFYPGEGVSLIQERQMVTQEGSNTAVCSIRGNFDDAQNGVKAMFNDRDLNRLASKNGFMFSSANSINIGRLIPQIVYYIYAYTRLIKTGAISEGEQINIVVPTGNFGNILAANYARSMGLPVKNLVCASNENNVLYDFINTGVYSRLRKLSLTISPSMDILISSNLERLIFDLCGRDSDRLKGLFEKLSEEGIFTITDRMKKRLEYFVGGFATDDETISAIGQIYKDHDYLIDTHTAVGYFVYKNYLKQTQDRTKTVIAATASPFKFPASVIGAISKNQVPGDDHDEFQMLEILSDLTKNKIPVPLRGLGNKKIIHSDSCSIDRMKDFVADFLELS